MPLRLPKPQWKVDAEAAFDAEGVEKSTLAELKKRCQSYGIKASGTKKDLVSRLKAHAVRIAEKAVKEAENAVRAREGSASEIEPIGSVSWEDRYRWYKSDATVAVPLFGSGSGNKRRFHVKDYDRYQHEQGRVSSAISNFFQLSKDSDCLRDAAPFLLEYLTQCRDDEAEMSGKDPAQLPLPTLAAVWNDIRWPSQRGGVHVELYSVDRATDAADDGQVDAYVILECGHKYAVEHGVQVVFKNGESVCKVGSFDGNPTNVYPGKPEWVDRVFISRADWRSLR
jgi:Domain of unknown function (DUF6985)/SAP domain